jgi:hypothetical protein
VTVRLAHTVRKYILTFYLCVPDSAPVFDAAPVFNAAPVLNGSSAYGAAAGYRSRVESELRHELLVTYMYEAYQRPEENVNVTIALNLIALNEMVSLCLTYLRFLYSLRATWLKYCDLNVTYALPQTKPHILSTHNYWHVLVNSMINNL